MMKPNRDCGWPWAFVQIPLERDARATRPVFSQAFHERLMDRIAHEVASGPSAERLQPKASPPAVSRILARAGGGLAALLVALWAVVWLAGRLADGPGILDVAPRAAIIAVAERPLDGERLVSIDSMPLYDDLDSGLRAGIWTLAESLVELPEWANMADFDAAPNPSLPHRGPNRAGFPGR